MVLYYTTCDECGEEEVEITVRLGRMQEYEPGTASICEKCLKEALEMIQKHQAKGA